jgi:hypothetical protein
LFFEDEPWSVVVAISISFLHCQELERDTIAISALLPHNAMTDLSCLCLFRNQTIAIATPTTRIPPMLEPIAMPTTPLDACETSELDCEALFLSKEATK